MQVATAVYELERADVAEDEADWHGRDDVGVIPKPENGNANGTSECSVPHPRRAVRIEPLQPKSRLASREIRGDGGQRRPEAVTAIQNGRVRAACSVRDDIIRGGRGLSCGCGTDGKTAPCATPTAVGVTTQLEVQPPSTCNLRRRAPEEVT